MTAPHSKKIKLASGDADREQVSHDKKEQEKDNPFEGVVLYILPDGIGPRRLELMTSNAIKNGFTVRSNMMQDVTHVLTELPLREDCLKKKEFISFQNWEGPFLETRWLYESIKSHGLVAEIAYTLPSLPSSNKNTLIDEQSNSLYPDPGFDLKKFNECVAERRAVLDHPNKLIAESLDLLEEYWSLCFLTHTDELRALAFARAAAAVKCLPFKVTDPAQLKGIKDLGDGHALRIATQIVESGQSAEVEEKRNDPKFRSFKVFCNVFGVGPSIAKKWYASGLRTVEDLKKRFNDLDTRNNEMIRCGVAFFEDLNTPLLLSEAEKIYTYIIKLAKHILPSVVTSMNGGFRRGKSSGHDVDVLFSYPERDDGEYGLIPAIHSELEKKGLVVWSRSGRADGPKETDLIPAEASNFDRLLLHMLIVKFPTSLPLEEFENRDFSADKVKDYFQLAASHRDWRAIRVDLVGSTTTQYAYAQIGWTGNKQYNRCLRQYAKDSLGYSLSSTGLYDTRQHRWISAQTERDVFDHLRLSYREPWERNF